MTLDTDEVYVVYNQGQSEDWPQAIFWCEETAIKFAESRGFQVSKVSWLRAMRWWEDALYI